MQITRSQFLLSLGAVAGAAWLRPSLLADETVRRGVSAVPNDLLDSQRFRMAVVRGEVETVRRYLAADPALRFSKDDQGRSVFVLAHLSGHPEIAGLFLELGLELDIVEASIVGDWERVKAIGELAPGLVNADHAIGGTAMYAAALFGHGTPMFRLNFVGGDPNANPRGENGFTPVRAAMDCKDPLGAERAATYLIGNGGDVNAPQRNGDSVLHGAVRSGNVYLVEYVIRKGGRLDARNEAGQTPLELAVALEQWAIVETLQTDGRIARDMARNDPACSRLAYDANGSPYEPVALEGRPALLLSRVVGVSHGDFDAVRELIGLYPDLVHAKATTEEMAVEASAHMPRMTESVRFYLGHGAPLSLPTCLRLGLTSRAAELLRENPARVRERGPHDFALTYYPAIGGGLVDSAEILVAAGIEVNLEGQLGETGLHWAARSGQPELVEFWIDNGGDVNARTRPSHLRMPGATPLDFAQRAQQAGVVDLLKSRGGISGT